MQRNVHDDFRAFPKEKLLYSTLKIFLAHVLFPLLLFFFVMALTITIKAYIFTIFKQKGGHLGDYLFPPLLHTAQLFGGSPNKGALLRFFMTILKMNTSNTLINKNT